MVGILVWIVPVTWLFQTGSCLQCLNGYSVTSVGFNTSVYNETYCDNSLGNICGKIEASGFWHHFIQVEFRNSFCVNRTSCESSSCSTLFHSFASENDSFRIHLSNCSHVCCHTNYCNNLTMSLTTSPPPTTSPTPTTPPLPSTTATTTPATTFTTGGKASDFTINFDLLFILVVALNIVLAIF